MSVSLPLPGYDTWLQPLERSGIYEVTCKHEPATCAACELVVPEPERVTLYEPRRGERPPLHLRALKGVLPYIAERCPRCGSEEYGPDTCGEVWTSNGNWQEGAGVELREGECPRCQADGDKLEVEPVEEDY